MDWDPDAYEQFAAARERPFDDLLARVPARSYATILDAGCGTGRTTHALARRFEGAQVVGIDASREMLDAAKPGRRVSFRQANLTSAEPQPSELVVCNAVLHWISEPRPMVERLASWVAPGGVLAIQVPANHDQPSHRIVGELAAEPTWARRLADLAIGDHVLPLAEYVSILGRAGFEVDAWQTTYLHQLQGRDAVLEWLKATTLRPHLARLEPDAPAFLAQLAARLGQAYPPTGAITPLPFTRRFVVATATRAPAHGDEQRR